MCPSCDLESPRESIEEVAWHFETDGDSLALAALLKNLADLHERLGHRQRARDLLERARGISERLSDQDGIASSLLSEVALWTAHQDFEHALDCAQRAAEISEKTGNRHNLRAALTNCAASLTMLGRVDEAKTIHVTDVPPAGDLHRAQELNPRASLPDSQVFGIDNGV